MSRSYLWSEVENSTFVTDLVPSKGSSRIWLVEAAYNPSIVYLSNFYSCISTLLPAFFSTSYNFFVIRLESIILLSPFSFHLCIIFHGSILIVHQLTKAAAKISESIHIVLSAVKTSWKAFISSVLSLP